MVATDRTKSIGASEAFRAVNLDFSLWAEKTGLAEPPSLDDVEAVYWGTALEDRIINRFAEVTGRAVLHNRVCAVFQHPQYPFMTATPDAEQAGKGGKGMVPLEVKNVGYYLAKEWRDEPPLRFQVQLQHQVAVLGADWGSLCALIGGNRLRWFDMDRNEKFIQVMIEQERAFWALVKSKTPPPADGSIATTEVLKRLYPKDDGEVIALPMESREWDTTIQDAKQNLKADKLILTEYENKMKAALGTATRGVLPSGGSYTFKQQVVNHKAKEAFRSTHRVLRRVAK